MTPTNSLPPAPAWHRRVESGRAPASIGRQISPDERFYVQVWGAHGGAGTTTLTSWLQPAHDRGVLQPGTSPRFRVELAIARSLVIVCRNTPIAARAAGDAVTALIVAGGHVSVLAVVSDGWPEPAAATSRFRLLAPRAGTVIPVPFVPGLRLADDPAAVPLPRIARRAVEQIRAAAGLPPLPPVPELPRKS